MRWLPAQGAGVRPYPGPADCPGSGVKNLAGWEGGSGAHALGDRFRRVAEGSWCGVLLVGARPRC